MPKLILVCGTSFSGKSTLARLLRERFGYAEVDVDETKAQLFGESVTDDRLGRNDWEQIYLETDLHIARRLSEGHSVIDASRNFRKAERQRTRAIGEACAAEIVTIHVDTPEHVTRQRLLANRRSRDRRDVTDDDFIAILAAWEPPSTDEHPLVFCFGDDVVEWMDRNADALRDD